MVDGRFGGGLGGAARRRFVGAGAPFGDLSARFEHLQDTCVAGRAGLVRRIGDGRSLVAGHQIRRGSANIVGAA